MLAKERCKPCTAQTPRVPRADAERLRNDIPEWRLAADGRQLVRDWVLPDFRSALAFVDDVGQVAEEEGHHPDLHLTGYKRVRIELSTHAIGGLSRNDFILAAKIDRIAPLPAAPASSGASSPVTKRAEGERQEQADQRTEGSMPAPSGAKPSHQKRS